VAGEQIERRLVAILMADVAGYSRLIGIDDEGTLAQLNAHHAELIEPKIKEHRGRIVRTTGDGLLVLFVSAVEALRCAVEIQRGMTERIAEIPADRRIKFRMGVNVGDIVEGASIHGDGINVAARLEALADVGGICVSSRVQEDAQGSLSRLRIAFHDMGQHQLKNIRHAVRVYQVLLDEAEIKVKSSVPETTRLEIDLLGAFAVRADATEVRLQSRKGCALLGYLALADSNRSTRESLLGLLWSESSENKARTSLRQVIHEVHNILDNAGYVGFQADRLTLRLAPSSLSVDVLDVIRFAKEGRAHPKLLAKERPIETLMRDFETIDPAFSEWLVGIRRTLRQRLVDDLTTALRSARPGMNQLELSRTLVNLEPTHEEATRNIVRAQANAGDVGGALRTYKHLKDLLEREFDAEPAKETQELIAAIKIGHATAVASSEKPPAVVVAQPAESGATAESRPSRADIEAFIRTLVNSFGGRLVAGEHNRYAIDFPEPRAATQAMLGVSDDSGRHKGQSPLTGLQMGAHASFGQGRAAATEVAGQLAALARPGELLVSDQMRDVLTDGLDVFIEDTGEHEAGTPPSPMRAFRVSALTEQRLYLEGGHIQPVLAIMPFDLIGNQRKHLLFGEILAEELIANFSAGKEIAVISRLSTRPFKGRSSSLEELRERLHATYVVSGQYSVRGTKIEVLAEFADARSETLLWRQQFKGDINAFLRGPAEVVDEMVAAISASVLSRELDRVRSRPLETLENYSLLMAAINLSHRTSYDSFLQARGLLEFLMERLPVHPLPLAWLAKWFVFRVNQGWSEDRASDSQKALGYATQAVESDPTCSIALTVNAWANLNLQKRFDVANEQFERAVEANPNDSTAWLLKGMMHAFKGQGRQAVTAAQHAIHLSPLDPRRSYYDSLAATAYLSAGDFERAIELAKRSLRVDGLHQSTLRALAIAQFLSGRVNEARETLGRVLRLDPTLTVGKYLSRHPAAEFSTGQLWAKTLGEAGLPK
jgi:adenylate cyclase